MEKEKIIPLQPVQHVHLIKLYEQQPRTSDDLAYTDEMESIYKLFNQKFPNGPRFSRRDLYLHLKRIRKAGGLPRKGRV